MSLTAFSPGDHDALCLNHESPRAGLCTAFTRTGKQCRRRTKAFDPLFAPLCKIHQFQRRPIGKCQALEDCGQPCSRLALYDTPYHLCEKHQKGNNDLPCHLLRLPVELRFMIFRDLFPQVVRCSNKHGVNVAILKVNRQLHQEAASILYGESHFEVSVESMHIRLQGKCWYRQPFWTSPTNNYTIHQGLSQTSARFIRNLDVVVTIGARSKCPNGINLRGISHEDQELFMVRDSVRKLVELLTASQSTSRSTNTLKRLTVKPMIENNWAWKSDEAIVALFVIIQPLQMLRQIDYPVLEAPSSQWQKYPGAYKLASSMQNKKKYGILVRKWRKPIQASPTDLRPADVGATVKQGYQAIEAFAQLIYVQDASSTSRWTMTTFYGIERVLHLARVAYENNDTHAIEKIHEAIKVRWVNAYRQQQEPLRAVADSINNMFERGGSEAEEELTSPRKLYPDAFLFEDVEPIQQSTNPSAFWLELETEDNVPRRGDPGVTVKERGLKRYVWKDGKRWVQWMTPAMIREMRERK